MDPDTPELRALLHKVTRHLLTLPPPGKVEQLERYHADWLAEARSSGKSESEARNIAGELRELTTAVLATLESNRVKPKH